MKKIQFVPVIFISLLTFFSSCSKKDNTVVVSASTTSSVVVQGNWRVTYFNDSGADSTVKYSGYKLLFTAGGSVAIYNDLLAVNGTWSTHNDDSSDKLLLNFSSMFTFISALNHDWHIVEKTVTKLRMEDVSGGAGRTDYLTIEKN